MNTSPENNTPLVESEEKVVERVMEQIIAYADKHKLTAREMDGVFSMVTTEDSSKDGLRPELLELRNLMVGVKTNQPLNESVRSYIRAAFLTENLGTTFN